MASALSPPQRCPEIGAASAYEVAAELAQQAGVDLEHG
jgi:hypothetical protein